MIKNMREKKNIDIFFSLRPTVKTWRTWKSFRFTDGNVVITYSIRADPG